MKNTKQHFKDQIEEIGIPKSDTVGLKVTNRAPVGFTTIKGKFVNNGKSRLRMRPGTNPNPLTGMYIGFGSTVHVVKNAPVYTLIHEIGHHVTQYLNNQNVTQQKQNDILVTLSKTNLAYYGLRAYSLSNWLELMADCYMVRYYSAKVQWENLVKFFGTHGINLVTVTAARV